MSWTIGTKVFLIMGLMFLPIAHLLVPFAGQVRKDTAISAREIRGTEAIAPAWLSAASPYAAASNTVVNVILAMKRKAA